MASPKAERVAREACSGFPGEICISCKTVYISFPSRLKLGINLQLPVGIRPTNESRELAEGN